MWEPFTISKGPGAGVLSGAINGDSSLTIRATRVAVDSRYARIMQVMQQAEQRRPRLRRIGDQLGAWYTPAALLVAVVAWWSSGDPVRFLSVVVVATPCPLIIAIPVAIIGAISTAAARRHHSGSSRTRAVGVVSHDDLRQDRNADLWPPSLSEEDYGPGFDRARVLPLVAALERFSRHPLAGAIVRVAEQQGLALPDVQWLREAPGRGLEGRVANQAVIITSRARIADSHELPPAQPGGLECVILIDDRYAATYRFHDVPRADSRGFVTHLGPRHGFSRVILVTGDRESEARRLATAVAISEVHAGASPEDKVAIARRETARAKTMFVGDGINDAPALASATVGIAFGQNSDVTAEAAGAVVIDTSLSKVDELIHLSRRLRHIALQSAVGGMVLSGVAMVVAAFGGLSPVAGAVVQEGIDLFAVVNALRTARTPSELTDF